MKIIEIIGENYSGSTVRTRAGCRCIVIENGMLLMSYEAANGIWMLPGGGIEDGETPRECCIREVAEETGAVVRPSECLLEIDEYYEDVKYVNMYFTGTVTGKTAARLIEAERRAGMEPRRIPLGDALAIFAGHAAYAGKDEMTRGMYLREYTALRFIAGAAEAGDI